MLRPFRSSGFTVVELLVVVALMALLTALIFLALARGKARARVTQCQNNLRQWGLAFQQYADDNQDILPRRGQ